MEIIFQESIIEFENVVDKAEFILIEGCSDFLSDYDTYHYITEKSSDTLSVKIKKFFSDIIAAFQKFKSEIKIKISEKFREANYKNKLESLHKECREKKKEGLRKVEVTDIWTLTDVYLDAVNKLKGISIKFCKMNYKHTSQIDKDLESFNNLVESYEEKIEKCSNKKVTVGIDRMINFVEDEISERSRVFKTLNESITLFEQMQADAELVAARRDILGPDIITKHVGFIRKMGMKITGFIKRIIVKIITTVVFLFA